MRKNRDITFTLSINGGLTKEIVNKAITIVRELHDLAIVHNNLYWNNFSVDILDNSHEMKLTGLSSAYIVDKNDISKGDGFKEDTYDLGKMLCECVFNSECSQNTAIYIKQRSRLMSFMDSLLKTLMNARVIPILI